MHMAEVQRSTAVGNKEGNGGQGEGLGCMACEAGEQGGVSRCRLKCGG